MKNIVKVPLIVIGVFVAVIVSMAALKLCPPQGPWPMPPWCESGIKLPKLVIPFIPGVNVEVSELKLENTIVIPTDLEKISYPTSYQQPIQNSATVKNPYCTVDAEVVAYPASYLGAYALPEIKEAPLPIDIRRAVGIKDSWMHEPNLNNCPIARDPMFDSFEKTLKRVKALNAQEIHITNFVSFKSFQDATLDMNSKVISDRTLQRMTDTASKNGLGVVLYLNVAPGDQKVSEIPNNEWLAKFIDNYEPFLLNQAQIAQSTGMSGLMLGHFDYQPSVKGHENVYNEKMLGLLKKVRAIYSGKIIFLIEPTMGADLNKMDKLLNEVDAYIYTPTTRPLFSSQDKTVSVSNLKGQYLKDFEYIGATYGKYKKSIYVRILVQSEKDFLVNGWNEDQFCIKRGDNPCYQKDLVVEFSAQAIAYEGIMEALKYAHNRYFQVGAVDTYGYWYTDVMLPKNSQPQMAHTIRNKPAESIVKAWFAE